ncbi:MAG: heavy-metal-associated domain-containing protein [Hydrogenophaga sp.]|nr:heavy-metal-associated domain-containing protein [Hydrogenophaga sp.]
MNQIFTVQGMTCGHCERAVTTAIKQLDPQAEVRIDRPQNRVEVDSQQARDKIAEAIREEGYAVSAP